MNNAKILIVEDEAIIAADLQRRLEHLGYTITSAVAAGEEAIRKAGEDFPELVLMDIVLPGDIDGIEAASKIRELFDIPFVYVTAYADEKIIEKAKLTEPFGYILKPFDDRELRSTIEMALYKSSIEKQLKKNNIFLRNVIESLSHPFYVINADDYTVVMANSSARFGELSATSKCYSLTHHADGPCEGLDHPCLIREISQTGTPSIQEHVHYDEKGNARTYQIYGYPIFDRENKVIQIIEYTQDITDKKILESQFRQSQKMEAVGRLAGGIAHDFNNLLTMIIGYSELALELPETELPEDHPVRKQLNIIADAGNKAATLVRQLLAFSKKQVLEIKSVNINNIVENIAKMLRLIMGEDLILEMALSPSITNVKADAGQIEQVLMNLAVNARDAMPCGGRVMVETENVELDEEYAGTHEGITPGQYVMLSFTDTGVGMSREVQEKIFEPFFTTKGNRGTGLGLATVYGIVKQHKGHIYVYSEPGIGSTFKIYLPATKDLDRAVAETLSKAPIMRGNETIMVVDDELSIRGLVTDTLEPLGYHILEASCGEEALQRSAMTEGVIDILITDVIMQDMYGPELARRMKEQRPAIEILYMSGYTDETIADFGIPRTKKRFIQKPLTPRKLSATVRDILDDR